MVYLKRFSELNESIEFPKLEFNKKPRKKGAKTDVYDVFKNGKLIGQVKWYSRIMGYGFRPTSDIEPRIKSFIREITSERKAR